MTIGRISGPLLKRNLIRDGVELTVRNTHADADILYIDVVNGRIGVNTDSPTQALDVNGTTKTTVLSAGIATVDNIEINDSTVRSTVGNLTIEAATEFDEVIIPRATIPDIQGDVTVTGNLHATGNITAEGSITLGDADTDDIVFVADVNSNVLPNTTDTFTLGSSIKRWSEGHFAELFVDGLAINTGGGNSVALLSDEVNKIYVHLGGDDVAGNGENLATAFRTVKHALSQAVSGDTVLVGAGIFEEEFPLTVPTGVTVAGSGIRSTTIKPTSATQDQDAFLLNGDTTVTDLTIKDVFYNASNDTGYAFQYVSGTTINRRSPYIKDVSVINLGSSINPTTDPFGFASGDAGRGIRVDGARVTSSSIEPAMLFDSVTLIVPNSVGLELTNGARVEWLNSFIYFADVGIDAYIGTQGVSGLGKTYLTLDGVQGTIQAGDTLTYYDLDGTTVIATDTVESVDSNIITIDGRSDDWIESKDRPTKTVSTNGDAQLSTTQAKFGSSSLQLDGTVDFLNILPNSDFGYGTSDFTIEGWVYKTADTGQESIFDFRTQASDNAIAVGVRNGNLPYVYVNGTYVIQSVTALTLNDWNHIAYVRSGSTGTLYLNGTNIGSWIDNVDYGTAKPFILGAGYTGGFTFWTGFIDEVRISKGISRYTANFTPTTIPFVGDNATVLLLHLEGTDGSTDIVDDGVTFQDIRSSSGGTATLITRHDRKEFAAEIRSIASANIYGTRGIRANGPDVRLRMSSHDFGYIGSGGDFSNNDQLVNTANEVIELNEGRVFYNSTDQYGDYRIGDLFLVDQDTGAVTFTGGQFDVTSLTGINFVDGVNSTIVDPSKIQTGNIRISGNIIESLVNGITISSINNEATVDSNLSITGTLDVAGQSTVASINIEDLTNDRIIISGVDGELEDDANFTFDGATFNIGATGEFTVDAATGNTKVKGTLDVDGQSAFASANIEDLTSGRVVLAGTDGEIEDSANLTFDGTLLTVTGNTSITGTLDVNTGATIATLQVEDLTSGRVVLAGTDGEIEDSANLTFDGTTLDVTGNVTVSGELDVDISATFASANIEDLTSGRVVLAGTNGEIEDSANLTFDGTTLDVTGNTSITGTLDVNTSATIATLQVEDLTDNRIVVAGAGGEIEDDANFRFDGTSFLIGPNLSETFTVEVATGNTDIQGTLDVLGRTILSSAAVEDLTSGRVVLAGTDGEIEDSANLTFDGTTLDVTGNVTVSGELDVDTSATIATLQVEDLTASRVVLAGTNGEIEDSENLTFDGTLLTVTGNTEITGNLTLGGNLILGDQTTDSVTVVADFTSDLIPNQTGEFNLGSALKKWNEIYSTSLNVTTLVGGNIQISSNIIENVIENEGIIIKPNGTGTVEFDTSSAVKLPSGSDGSRPVTSEEGQIRYNTSSQRVENRNNETWISLATEDDAIAFSIALG